MTTTLYDADGEVTESIDAMGRITTTLYDKGGEVTESIDHGAHDDHVVRRGWGGD